jgi:hypothetical protein
VTHYEQPFVTFGQTIETVGAAAVPLGSAEVDGDQAAPCHRFGAGDSCFRFHSVQNNGRQQTLEYVLRSMVLELVRAATQNQYDGRADALEVLRCVEPTMRGCIESSARSALAHDVRASHGDVPQLLASAHSRRSSCRPHARSKQLEVLFNLASDSSHGKDHCQDATQLLQRRLQGGGPRLRQRPGRGQSPTRIYGSATPSARALRMRYGIVG